MRDLRGYGQFTPDPKWPNNAALALNFVVNYEEGGENCIVNGDLQSEVFLNETPGGIPRKCRDINMETQYEYGSRAGVWRLLRLFRKHSFAFTCYAVGRAVELNPNVIKAMEEEGHEIASHNYRWIDYGLVDDQTTADHVRKSIIAIQNASSTQRAPVGFYTGRIGERTRQIVFDVYEKMGLPLLYESDAYNDDLPYWIETNGKQNLVIPYTLDQNDMKFCVPPGFGGPDAFFTYLKNAFDVLREEGLDGSPKLMTVGLHCRLAGKPGRAAALQQFLAYVATFDDVWICTREQVARHWRDEHPFITSAKVEQ